MIAVPAGPSAATVFISLSLIGSGWRPIIWLFGTNLVPPLASVKSFSIKIALEHAAGAIAIGGSIRSGSKSKFDLVIDPTGRFRLPGRVGSGAHHWSVCKFIFEPPGFAIFDEKDES